jgi:chromosome segregation ATPase
MMMEKIMKSEIEMLHSAQRKASENLDVAEAAMSRERMRCNELLEQLHDLKANFDSLLEDYKYQHEAIIALLCERDELFKSDNKHKEEIEKLTHQLVECRAQYNELEAKFDEVSQTLTGLQEREKEAAHLDKALDLPVDDVDDFDQPRTPRTIDTEELGKQNMILASKSSTLETERDALEAKCTDLGTKLRLAEAEIVSLAKSKELCEQNESVLRSQVEHMTTEKSSMECDMAVLKGELDVLRQSLSFPSGVVAQTLGYCVHCGQRTAL